MILWLYNCHFSPNGPPTFPIYCGFC